MSEPVGAARILLIDDDIKLCRLIKDYLTPLGYDVTLAHTGPTGLALVEKESFAAVVLDVMLPGLNGYEVLRQIRQHSTVPVLMLTAMGDEADRIAGLEMGADDYLPKTFSTRELLARLRAVTRRSAFNQMAPGQMAPGQMAPGQMAPGQMAPGQMAPGGTAVPGKEEAICVQELRLDPGARRAWMGEQSLTLTPVEYDLLLTLARSADRVISREQLLNEIADRNYEVFDRSIDVHISSLRRKLGDDARHPRYIRTVRSAGYMLVRHPEE